MDENKITEQVLSVADTEAEKRDTAAITTMVASIVQKEREAWAQEIREELEGFEQPDRSNIPEFHNRNGETVHRQTSPTEPVYRRMSEEEQEWRSPDADHWYREWIVGQVRNDRAQMFQAEAKLEGLFGRAATVEGAAGASGALSAGLGGALIPRPLEQVIMIARDRAAKMRRFASSFVMTRQTHTVPTASAMTAAMTAESATASGGEPTFDSVQFTAKKAQVTAVASLEMLDDAAIALVNVYAQRGGAALGSLEDAQFFKDGDGSGNNISAAFGGTAYAEGSSGVLTVTDMLAMYHQLGQQYRDNSAWYVAGNVLQLLAGVRDGTGRQIYTGLGDNAGVRPITDDPTAVGTILGRNVYDVPTTDGEIVFGDMGALYMVGRRQGIVSAASEHVLFDADQFMWKFTERFDGNNIDTVAAKHASGITSATSA